MKCNVGKTDKIIRYVIGAVIIIAGFVLNSWLGLIGLIPIATAIFGWCPLYIPLGINTGPKE
jgi:hypothetical protein